LGSPLADALVKTLIATSFDGPTNTTQCLA
jgi:hypothetical protein